MLQYRLPLSILFIVLIRSVKKVTQRIDLKWIIIIESKERKCDCFWRKLFAEMASLSGRWQGLALVALRALSRDQAGLVRALGRNHVELGLTTTKGIATPVNTFSSFSPMICRLGPLPCAQVFFSASAHRNLCVNVSCMDWKTNTSRSKENL